MKEKKKGSGAVPCLIGIIIILLLVLYFSSTKTISQRYTDKQILDYVADHFTFSEVKKMYPEADIVSEVREDYSVNDLYDDVVILSDYSWYEIIDFGFRDEDGETLLEFTERVQREQEETYRDHYN